MFLIYTLSPVFFSDRDHVNGRVEVCTEDDVKDSTQRMGSAFIQSKHFVAWYT